MADRDPDGDVIDQADALMRRYRSFVARPANDEGVPASDTATDSDIPVLTEIVVAGDTAPGDIGTVLDTLQADLDAVLSAWLIDVLPAAVANASQQILAELDVKARNTLLPRLREVVATHRSKLAEDQSL